MKTITHITFALLLMICSAASVFAAPNYHKRVFLFSGNYGYAKTDGFIQIPAGGKPGSSSVKRPTLSELKIDHANLFKVMLALNWKYATIYGSYQYERPDGHAVLASTLTTHAMVIPAGTSFSADTKFDLYRVGITHYFLFHDGRFILFPQFEVALLNFNYRFHTQAAASGRHFNQVTPRLGLGAEYIMNPKFSIVLQGASSIPRLKNLDVQTASLTLYYTAFHNPHLILQLFTGVDYQRINFKDKQTFPNHIRVRNSPMGVVGIQIAL